jgi:hypothetical protein
MYIYADTTETYENSTYTPNWADSKWIRNRRALPYAVNKFRLKLVTKPVSNTDCLFAPGTIHRHINKTFLVHKMR